MTIGILTEKPSAARNFAKALGGMSGKLNGEDYVIAHARGHLYEFVDPAEMVDPDKKDDYASWKLENLPWTLEDFNWKLQTIKGAGSVATDVKKALSKCDEIVIATDVDPSGEGGMIAVNAFLQLGLRPAKFSRMYFTDEAPASLKKAFGSRKVVQSLRGFDEYKMASYRSKFDFASMQFTRAATNIVRRSGEDVLLRQGRLKSAMVKLVGDQLKDYNEYVKKPFFQNRFRDENQVMYTNPEEPQFEKPDQVPASYKPSPVVVDSTTRKHTAPPKLMDLAALSSMLVPKGVKAKDVLATYQKMYEAQVVSYPRTEDKTITPEQFKELSPLVDDIAKVVGVDTALLTHREPRKTHVKPQGAHGANRPGTQVPASLEAVESAYGKTGRLIYEALAKNYLAMLAADYAYDQQKGHVQLYPDFVGQCNIPREAGWKSVFNPDAGDASAAEDSEDSSLGLGTNAEPFVFEGANKRPEHPSMKWLMKQLEKRDVGTGATRTSTYSEVTNDKAKYPLLVERGSKLSLARPGELSWMLLPGTHIGDLTLTEKVYADMREIAAGTKTEAMCLAEVAALVTEDIARMQKNAQAMVVALGLSGKPTAGPNGAGAVQKERAAGLWKVAGQDVKFAREWGGHRFSDEEVTKLLAGEMIGFNATNSSGKSYDVYGKLAQQTFKGRSFVGFEKIGFGKLDASGQVTMPDKLLGHVFTAAERKTLMTGKSIEATDLISSKGNTFGAVIWYREKVAGSGIKDLVLDFDTPMSGPPASWCKYTFSAEEKKKLAAGETISAKGCVSKAGKKFDAKLSWKEEGGKKKIVPSF